MFISNLYDNLDCKENVNKCMYLYLCLYVYHVRTDLITVYLLMQFFIFLLKTPSKI